MADALTVAAAMGAGLAVSAGAVALGWPAEGSVARRLLEGRRRGRVRQRRAVVPALPLLLSWLRMEVERAGWRDTPERIGMLGLIAVAAGGLSGATVGSLGGAVQALTFGLLGAAASAAAGLRVLRQAAAARRSRLLGELAPLLDLLGLELGGGSSPLGAIASVTGRTQGELSSELRSLLAAAAISGGPPFDLPPLCTLASLLATSRDYGSGVAHGVRAISIDLRQAQRREVIAASRRALTRVLVPSAFGVLLPFLGVLLYPAVSALTAGFP
jgi:Flp pilus assembly protein TadB